MSHIYLTYLSYNGKLASIDDYFWQELANLISYIGKSLPI